MAEKNSKHPFPWVLFLFLMGLFQLGHAFFEGGKPQQIDIVLGVSMIGVGLVLVYRNRLIVRKQMFLAFNDGPQCSLSLVRDYGIYPHNAFEIIRNWKECGWVAACDPPADHDFAAHKYVWYCLTMRGLKELPEKLGIEPGQITA